VGSDEGWEIVGRLVGDRVGFGVGLPCLYVGEMVGLTVGLLVVGVAVGAVGLAVGDSDGEVGLSVGNTEGRGTGGSDGRFVGADVGTLVRDVGFKVGDNDGLVVGDDARFFSAVIIFIFSMDKCCWSVCNVIMECDEITLTTASSGKIIIVRKTNKCNMMWELSTACQR
jgi:hypothetical protein